MSSAFEESASMHVQKALPTSMLRVGRLEIRVLSLQLPRFQSSLGSGFASLRFGRNAGEACALRLGPVKPRPSLNICILYLHTLTARCLSLESRYICASLPEENIANV